MAAHGADPFRHECGSPIAFRPCGTFARWILWLVAIGTAAEQLRERLRTLTTLPAILYREQNGGDYLIPTMQLRPEPGDPGVVGFGLHLKGQDRGGVKEAQ